MNRSHCQRFPIEIQEIICSYLLADDSSNRLALKIMGVNKAWGIFVCERLYRNCTFKTFTQFIGFSDSVIASTLRSILPYHKYVRCLDFSPVNKYGVDTRARRLIKYCSNVETIKFGQTTSVKTNTIRLLGRHCQNVQELEIGGFQCYPFMFDCDFSNLKSLRRITLTSTPLQADSLHTLPNTVEHIEISQMDALVHSDLVKFLKSHINLKTLKLSRCRHINKQFAELLTLVPALRSLELIGPGIDDKGVKELFDMPRALKLLRLHHTQISDETLESLANGCLNIEHLDISHNSQISQLGITRLLKQKETNRITRVGIVA